MTKAMVTMAASTSSHRRVTRGAKPLPSEGRPGCASLCCRPSRQRTANSGLHVVTGISKVLRMRAVEILMDESLIAAVDREIEPSVAAVLPASRAGT